MSNKKKKYSYGGITYRSVSAVLDAAPKVHRELANTVESVISSVAAANAAAEKDAQSKKDDDEAIIDPDKVTAQSLTALLRAFSPLQLLVDRTKSSKIAVHSRKCLGVLSMMNTVHRLVAEVDGEGEDKGDSEKGGDGEEAKGNGDDKETKGDGDGEGKEPKGDGDGREPKGDDDAPAKFESKAKSEYEKLTDLVKLLASDKRTALPHASWKPLQDAVLIRAIAKHGWIDRDRASRAIAMDADIKWGRPFDEGLDIPAAVEKASFEKKEKEQPPRPPPPYDEVKAVAARAADFLNSEHGMIPDLKGFNINLIARSYSLARRDAGDGDGAAPGASNWVVDEDTLRRVVENAGRGGDGGEDDQDDEEMEEPDQDLPSKKDLSKRIKMVLTRTANAAMLVTVSAQHAAMAAQQTSGTGGGGGGGEANTGTKHNFCVLDQSDGCNVYLTELLHAVLRVSITKPNGQKHTRRLLRYASDEVEKKIAAMEKAAEEAVATALVAEKEETAPFSITAGEGKEGAGGASAPSSEAGEEKKGEDAPQSDKPDDERKTEDAASGKPVETKSAEEKKDGAALVEMKKLKDNLRFVGRTIKVWNRQAKNIVRCILGMEPLKPTSSMNPIFPPEKLEHYSPVSSSKDAAASAAAARPSKEKTKDLKKAKQKQRDSAAGDVAINRALAAGLHKGKKKLMLQSMNEDGSPAPCLRLTSIETLILSVICSQGLPIWTEEWESLVDPQCCVEGETSKGEEFVINWYRMGGVVLNAATVWQNIASKSLQAKQRTLERNRANFSEDALQELRHECKQLQEDLDRKAAAIADARQLRSDPHLLARKSIMMLESLRRLMGPVESKSAGASKKMKELSRQESGLGPRVVQWASKELNRWANCLNIVEDSGRCISSTASDYMEGAPNVTLAAFFDKKACRTIFIQVAQQTRLRSVFIKNGTDEITSLMPKVLRNSRKNGDDWTKRPSWWSSTENACKDDANLLVGLLDYGYSGFDEMLRQNSSFRVRIDSERKTIEEAADSNETPQSGFTRAAAQLRANHLTRELNTLEDTADVMRLVSERAKQRVVSQAQDHGGSPENNEAGSKRSSSIQTGIDVFFRSSQGSEKKIKSSSKVSDTESVNSVEVIDVDGDDSAPNDKRKSIDDDMLVVESSKKLKES